MDGSSLVITNSYISDGAYIVADHGGQLVADHVFIGRNCVIVACQNIRIGRDSLIAEMVVIRDQNHRFDDTSKPIREQGFSVAPVIIGENVWLGAKSTILAGSVVGDGAVVGAHSLVSGVVPSCSLAVGTPAYIKKMMDS